MNALNFVYFLVIAAVLCTWEPVLQFLGCHNHSSQLGERTGLAPCWLLDYFFSGAKTEL